MDEIIEIDPIGMKKLDNGQHVHFHSRAYDLVNEYEPAKIGLPEPLKTEWKGNIDTEEDIGKEVVAETLTKTMNKKNEERDRILTYIFRLIRACVFSPEEAEEKAASELALVINSYGRVQRESCGPQSPAYPGHAGGRARTGAATLAGGHEDHVRALQRGGDFVNVVLRSLTADGGIRTGTQAVRQFATDVKLCLGIGHEKSLRVSVDRDELNALEADLDHSVHGVNSAPADADDLDHCQVVLRCRHGCLPCIRPSTSS